jgi:prepilin-type N-terminal cleavage/methylation domain-containing protein
VSHRRGFTLIETLLAIVIVGILALIGYPKVSRGLVKTDVRGARTTLANMFARARTAATTGNRKTAVQFAGNQVLVTASPRLTAGGSIDTVGAVQDLHAVYGVTVATTLDSFAFDPRGIRDLGAGSVTVSVARSGYKDSVVVDALGRIVK